MGRRDCSSGEETFVIFVSTKATGSDEISRHQTVGLPEVYQKRRNEKEPTSSAWKKEEGIPL